jgi:hypothetical protein
VSRIELGVALAFGILLLILGISLLGLDYICSITPGCLPVTIDGIPDTLIGGLTLFVGLVMTIAAGAILVQAPRGTTSSRPIGRPSQLIACRNCGRVYQIGLYRHCPNCGQALA